MALSILTYNLPHGLKMSASNKNSSASSPTGDENSPNNGGTGIGNGCTTISLGKSFSRITMQNVLSESSGNALNISNNGNVNTIVRKIKDFGMYGSVNNAAGTLSATIGRKRTANEVAKLRSAEKAEDESKPEKPKVPNKRPKLTNKDEGAREKISKNAANKATVSNLNRLKNNTHGVKKPAGTPGRKGLPLPQAVARRNARERNRVKQVNNGFAALRERIPEEVAEAFEAQGNGRGTVKKLSKVETLRMAVEYIRSLERLLGFNFPIGSDRGLSLMHGGSSSDDSFTFIKDEFDALSPPLDDTKFDDTLSNYDMDEYLNTTDFGNKSISQPAATAADADAYELDLLPNLTTINGMQYIRIPGTNTYQLLTPNTLFMGNAPHSPPNSSLDDESFQTVIGTNCLSPVATTSSPHISPSLSATSINTAPATETVALQRHPAATPADGETRDECINVAVVGALSRSPAQSSPTMHSSLHQQQQEQQQRAQQQCQPQTPTQGSANLSPADNDRLLLQACATTTTTADEVDGNEGAANVQRQQFAMLPTPTTMSLQSTHAIKQEFNDTLTGFVPPNMSPSSAKNLSAGAILFQQELQERLILSHAPLCTMSPPLERCSSRATPTNVAATTPTMVFVSAGERTPTTPGLPSFYSSNADNSYYENTNIIMKKEYNSALLDAVSTVAANEALGGLPDENIIEVLDWWEAHTPKSDSSGALL